MSTGIGAGAGAQPTGPEPAPPAAGAGDLLELVGGHPLHGTVRTPGDKSISHRALLLAALAEGTSTLRGLSDGEDVARTAEAVAALGASVEPTGDGALVVRARRGDLHPPEGPLDMGNSGTGMRLLAGTLAGLGVGAELVGDPSLSARPMDRIAEPLRAMGATVEGRGPRCLPPLRVAGAARVAIDWTPPVPSAQVKSCILLAGLGAAGETVVRESVATRSHTEEMLRSCGVDVDIEPWGNGTIVRLHPGVPAPLDLKVPGDPSQAAFWVVAGAVVPGSTVVVENLYAGLARIGFIGVLGRMGADVRLRVEPGGTIEVTARHGPGLRATVVEAAEIPSLDEVPALVVAAAVAEGTTVFRDVAELRVKESDRLVAAAELAEAFGARAEVRGDDLAIHGVGPAGRLLPASVDSGGDHRMAMAAAIAALSVEAGGRSTVSGFAAVATSYPDFAQDVATLGGSVRLRSTPADRSGSASGSATGAAPASKPGAARASGVAPAGASGVAPARESGVATATVYAPGAGADRLAPGEIVAIDGPAGSGKSTVSRTLAEWLGVARLDTGAMYRSVAWAALNRGIDPADAPAVADIARTARIEVGPEGTYIDGTDVTAAIRSPEVSRAVSVVAANPDVRRHLVERQRRWAAEHGGGVVEGRDIGSVVFPDAQLKVYLTASPDERARRRDDESSEGIARRDRIDSTRAASPLFVAPGARVVDTTGRSVDDVVGEVVSWL